MGVGGVFKDGASFCNYHTFCTSRVCSKTDSNSLRNLPTNTKVFLCSLWVCGKSRSLQGLSESPPKKKLGVTMHFSEIIEPKFGKKLPYILCIFKLF